MLLVDDETECLALIKQVLEYCGALVAACSSSRQALAVMQHVKPTVLVVGIRMPDEDAYSLIRSVRALPPEKGGTVPAVALTALGYDVMSDQLRARGFQAHLARPVHVSELKAAIVTVAKPRSPERNAFR